MHPGRRLLASRPIHRIAVVIVLACCVTSAAHAQEANASIPRFIKFSGSIKDDGGQPRPGTVGITFAIYRDRDGGPTLWMESQNVELDEAGHYTVLLGSETKDGLPLDIFQTDEPRWLGLHVQLPGEVEQPRILLVSVPYAYKAADADTLGGFPASAFVKADPVDSSTPDEAQEAKSPETERASTEAAAATVGTTNSIPRFDGQGALIDSQIVDDGNGVGIGMSSSSEKLSVAGNILLQGEPTHQVQLRGTASSGRFGQDSEGLFLASDTQGVGLRFLTRDGALQERARFTGDGSFLVGGSPNLFGEVAMARDDTDSVRSVIGQAGSQMHFRLSRATPDDRGARHFMISPYKFGTAIEYPGVIEVWAQEFSVHHHNLSLPGTAAKFWVGDQTDTGGLFATAWDGGTSSASYAVLAADKFAHTSHGSLHFQVRDLTDAFRFQVGPWGSEVTRVQMGATPTGSNLEVMADSVQAVLRAESSSSGSVQVGSVSEHRLEFLSGAGAPKATLSPDGTLSIEGAVTIGGGTPIVRHLSQAYTIDVPALALFTCTEQDFPVAGVRDRDTVALGVPSSLARIQGLTLFGWVDAPDTVRVRVCNGTFVQTVDPPTASLRIDVWQH